jgi:hypothetical protein
MESFDAKDYEDSKVSTGKFESFESKDSEMEEPVSENPKVSTRKFESFESKHSENSKSPDRILNVSTGKFESFESKDSGNETLTESIPTIGTIDSNVLRNVESFDELGQKHENESVILQEFNSTISNQKIKTFDSIKETKNDGRSKLRTENPKTD